MTEDRETPAPPPTTPTPIKTSIERDGKPGFIADLSFTLVVPWLLLWRFELPDVPGRSMWLGWWPVVVVVGLLATALGVGAAQRNPRGFLPYNVRWGLLAATLVLPAWIAISLADLDNRTVTLHSAPALLRPAIEENLAAAATPEAREQSRKQLDAVEAGERLAEAAKTLEEQGRPLPRSAFPDAVPESSALDPASKKDLEQAIALAGAVENNEPLPPGFAEATNGMDDAKILAALLVVAAPLIAPLLGLSTAVTLKLLLSLVESGTITVGSILRVAAALASSTLPGGGFDEAKVMKNFDEFGEYAQSVDILVEGARKLGSDVDDSPLGKLRSGKPGSVKAAERKELHDACRKAVMNERANPDLRKLMDKRCPKLAPDELDTLAREMSSGGRR